VSRQSRATSLSCSAGQSPFQALDGLPAESACALERWLDALADLPVDRWIAVGRAFRDVSDRRENATSCALLEAILADQQLELTAWYIGDMVKTTAYRAATLASRATRATRRDFAAARSAADWAALAIATQTWLPRVDRDTLCTPFTAVMENDALRLV
jgi:AcrR family transcriptional regulator